jgi:acyl-CoA dehydrogenase
MTTIAMAVSGADPSLSGAWELPDHFVMLRDTIRRFMTEEVRPVEERQPHDCYALPQPELDALRTKAKNAGLWCMASPEAYGGGGLGLLGQVIVAEEAAKCRMGAYVPACGAFGVDPPSVIWLGTEEQRRRYGIAGISGGKKNFVAISEAAGGSDPARKIETTAVRDGEDFIINGTKLWITGADKADWGIVFAKGEKGISAFIIDRESPGITCREIGVIRSYAPYEVHFENVRVPAANILGIEGKGFDICQSWLVHARVPYSAAVIGIAQAALDIAIDYARQRHVHKSLLSDKQSIQWMVADSEMELRAARLLVWQAAWNGDLGRDIKTDASIAKVVSTETAGRVVDRCIQILGAMGVAREMPLERWYRELRIKRIGEGPSEVHRMVLARELLRR